MSTDAIRFACNLEKLKAGWPAESSGPVCWALLPFDDHPVPPRKLEKAIRKRNKEYARSLKGADNNQAKSLNVALQAAESYIQLAKTHNAPYFVDLWTKLRTQVLDGIKGLN